MKNYFNFTLRGEELLKIWLIFLAVCIVPYILFFIMMDYTEGERFPFELLLLLIPVFIGTVLLIYYIGKLIIERTAYKDQPLEFVGDMGDYLRVFFAGMGLTIITIGIYSPWYIRNMMRYFTENTRRNGEPFGFRGDGGTLLLIILFGMLIPYMLIISLLVSFGGDEMTFKTAPQSPIYTFLTLFLFIPYYYLSYKWFIDLKHKDLTISWETDFWESCGQIALQVVLTILTIGIYGPLAFLKLYKYFMERTYARSEERSLRFGYDIEPQRDFLLLWGQLLLTIITLGIYYPWALAKVGQRVLSKTFTQEIEPENHKPSSND